MGVEVCDWLSPHWLPWWFILLFVVVVAVFVFPGERVVSWEVSVFGIFGATLEVFPFVDEGGAFSTP
jgi:hypothetical protein